MGEPATESARVPERPLLKPWWRIAATESGVVLRYGCSVLEFEGRAAEALLPHLLPLLDGRRSVDEIVSRLGEPVRPAVLNALALLAERRLLGEALEETLEPGAASAVELLAATDPLDRGATAAAETLRRTRLTVLGAGRAADAVAALLLESGVERTRRTGWDEVDAEDGSALVVAAPRPDEVPLLEAWNRRALASGTPWLQVLPFDGSLATVGPIVVPHESACHECFRLRRSANTSRIAALGSGRYPTAPALDSVLAGLAATLVLRWLVLDDSRCVGELLAVELSPTVEVTRHVLYRVPRCPECSEAERRGAPAPWHGVADVAA